MKLPDPLRVARSARAPELGPRIVFFSGGSALRPLSRVLKRYTHNSVHLITPFDSGGSSAKLRAAFNMLSIGDLRNRLVALADESARGNPEIYRIFCHRLPKSGQNETPRVEVETMVSGEHRLVSNVPEPMQRIIRSHLKFFLEEAPAEFDFRGANIGNLLLAGGYLFHDRDIESTLFLFSKLLEVRGLVRPSAETEMHLAADLADGRCVVGQHLLTGKQTEPLRQRIEALYLVESLGSTQKAELHAEDKVLRWIRTADLICYPMGSFFTSVMANLLPRGVGKAICQTSCPKLYVPNTGVDPEQMGMSVADATRRLIEMIRADAGSTQGVSDIMDYVLVDSELSYEAHLDPAEIRALGVQVIDLRLAQASSPPTPALDSQLLTEVLLSLSC